VWTFGSVASEMATSAIPNQSGKEFRSFDSNRVKDSVFTSDSRAKGWLSYLPAAINRHKTRTFYVQKITGGIAKNGEVLPYVPFEPIMLEYLKDPEEARACLNYVLREGEPADVFAALRDIAKAQGGFSKLARKTGLGRESLYHALSKDGNPSWDTVSKVLDSLGLRLSVERVLAPPRRTRKPTRPVASRVHHTAKRTAKRANV
jgi:probable addiction module antidote protein